MSLSPFKTLVIFPVF